VPQSDADLAHNGGAIDADSEVADAETADAEDEGVEVAAVDAVETVEAEDGTGTTEGGEEPDSEREEAGTATNGAKPRFGASAARSGTAATTGARTSRSTSQYDPMPTSELKTLMKRLDDRERALSMFAAPLGIAVAILVTIVSIHSNPAVHHKGHEDPSLIWSDGAVGMVLAVAVFALGWFRRRSLTSLALVFLGYSLGLIGIGIPFLFLGGYFFYRAWRVQKVLTSRGVDTRARAQPRSKDRASPRDQSRDSKYNRSTATTRKPTKTPSSRPQQSKRYTPPKPPPKRPPPSKPEQEDRTPRASIFDRQRNSERSSNG
jgi:hypothetical protein